jgi:hypothetical protein
VNDPQSRLNRVVIASLLIVFILTIIFTSIFSWMTLGQVRQRAHETDSRLRMVAWAVLEYADATGEFPVEPDDLLSDRQMRMALGRVSPEDPHSWPSTLLEALRDQDQMPSFQDSFETITVKYGQSSDIPPQLIVQGLPTLVGSLPEVNGWLLAFKSEIEQP